MPLPDDLELRDAGPEDLPTIADLRAAVGWAAHDWALRAAMAAPHARFLKTVDGDGRLAAIGSGISYGSLGYVGNMVVAEPHRRRGVGSAILKAVMAFLFDRGCTRLELYATEEGRPLYARHGFASTGPSTVARLPRHLQLGDSDAGARIAEAQPDMLERLVAYDAPRFGGDRRPLLEMMVADASRPMLVSTLRGDVVGYAWLRGDGPRLGPFIADEPEVAAALLAEAFRRLPNVEELTVNLPTANRPGSAWLNGLGVQLDPWDGRMARGTASTARHDTIYGNAVGALG